MALGERDVLTGMKMAVCRVTLASTERPLYHAEACGRMRPTPVADDRRLSGSSLQCLGCVSKR
jgi:hypothetical protein